MMSHLCWTFADDKMTKTSQTKTNGRRSRCPTDRPHQRRPKPTNVVMAVETQSCKIRDATAAVDSRIKVSGRKPVWPCVNASECGSQIRSTRRLLAAFMGQQTAAEASQSAAPLTCRVGPLMLQHMGRFQLHREKSCVSKPIVCHTVFHLHWCVCVCVSVCNCLALLVVSRFDIASELDEWNSMCNRQVF
jgi:hypothetical protein